MVKVKHIAKLIRDYGYFAVEASNDPAEYALFIAVNIGDCHCLLKGDKRKGDKKIFMFIIDIEDGFELPSNTSWHYETSMDGSSALVFEKECEQNVKLIVEHICKALDQLK